VKKGEDLDGVALIGVLICDDNAEIRTIMTEIIVLEPGLRVVGHATDGNEVVEQAKLLQPDVILLDLAMPKKNGLDALPELALAAPNAKTIVVSAFAAPSIVARALRSGAVGYVEKGNLMVDELLAAIRTAFGTSPAGPRNRDQPG
jgi:two-component system, chemotaxis family, chemotaxis protein CheY